MPPTSHRFRSHQVPSLEFEQGIRQRTMRGCGRLAPRYDVVHQVCEFLFRNLRPQNRSRGGRECFVGFPKTQFVPGMSRCA
ncbi:MULTISPECIES: hypothetical protein [unclassified Rhizobium]|uniref:hypothetical protein n=1 Tax=unclassified Rhizobium TaxID=2613769 RepID=UPI001AE39F2C|nr:MULTISPECIES: hypothetical protein [unclassified Rhizobium]MBP2460477.1 hypothetical protein [Rhizobium sp. PvP014]MBP2527874.1 hypothetical protein [Rhizobium sp. PvP099]